MNYIEIVGKSLVLNCNARDYTNWAVEQLENGLVSDSLVALASLLLEFFPEEKLAEKYFKSALIEIGIVYPQPQVAIFAYIQWICDETILQKIPTEYAMRQLKEICETIQLSPILKEFYHPMMGIWGYLEDDLYMLLMDEYTIYNTDLSSQNIEKYLYQVIQQFKSMLVLDLPKNFMDLNISNGSHMFYMNDFMGRKLFLESIKDQ